ncbi:G-alpha-domain-containing protein [Dendrothele bispora CBS 962.96]|uniref:G-alpha-domain-containing protein n=1 Tax=Dendrothele bispora (strain CBS 962.96) TaxID=1314807 RepID=A0A4S8LRR0_DENBC|nr:G-alpha-domain-containing protein [Dendrothele bispora CBS 962.96]
MPSRVRSPEDDSDPLTRAIAPPPDETPQEKEARLRKEAHAKRVSDTIDEELERQRLAERRGPKPVRVLLLGQTESGKSTTLKNFQLMTDPKAFAAERASWRAVIQLNLVRSIHVILDAMTRINDTSRTPSKASTSSSSSPVSSDLSSLTDSTMDPELLEIRKRLASLLQVEELLTRRLTPTGYGEVGTTELAPVTTSLERTRTVFKEVAVNSAVPWKEVFSKIVSGKSGNNEEPLVDWNDPNDPGKVLHECAEDMKRLWNHKSVQEMLEKQNLRLEEMAGFFLDSLDEVTSPTYLPNNDHILRARLKTLGVSEHRVKVQTGASNRPDDWRVFDVGGHRSLVTSWAPYFDNMDAIIFLAPISAFDQVLVEAPRVNRLEDSVLLWTSIVANKLLQHTDLILFLNKCDILTAKLASGIKLRDYVVSYGSRPNNFENAAAYLRKKFAGILKENSPLPRTFYCHLTSVTDTLSTQKVIASIRDMLMRDNLKQSTLLL